MASKSGATPPGRDPYAAGDLQPAGVNVQNLRRRPARSDLPRPGRLRDRPDSRSARCDRGVPVPRGDDGQRGAPSGRTARGVTLVSRRSTYPGRQEADAGDQHQYPRRGYPLARREDRPEPGAMAITPARARHYVSTTLSPGRVRRGRGSPAPTLHTDDADDAVPSRGSAPSSRWRRSEATRLGVSECGASRCLRRRTRACWSATRPPAISFSGLSRSPEAIQATPGKSRPERVDQRTVPSPAASHLPLANVRQASHILGAAANRMTDRGANECASQHRMRTRRYAVRCGSGCPAVALRRLSSARMAG